jgi:hypothetical protein
MGGRMISRTFDAGLIKEVINRPDIFSTIADDGFSIGEFEPDVQECWLEARDSKGLIGLFNLHVIDDNTLQAHCMVLPERRGKDAYTAGMKCLEWVVKNSAYETIVCMIPVIYRNVKLYTMKLGFVPVGIISKSYIKGGKILDMWKLAISRSDIEARL